MQGRLEAGHSSTIAIHQPPASSIEPNATSRWPIRLPHEVCGEEQVGQGERGQDQEGLQHLGEEGEADQGAAEGEPAHGVALDARR